MGRDILITMPVDEFVILASKSCPELAKTIEAMASNWKNSESYCDELVRKLDELNEKLKQTTSFVPVDLIKSFLEEMRKAGTFGGNMNVNRISIIKAMRSVLPLGLKECKDIVDRALDAKTEPQKGVENELGQKHDSHN